MSNLKILSRRAEKRIQMLLDNIEEYERRLKNATSDIDKKHLKEMIAYNNEALVAIFRNLL